ncbi:hypothetical protein LWI28_001122 [Acer negundo]|uniref:Uncharacterized protein n=1 Tax=Acer negundo TaxID=4023 RepID=A0AAD5JI09_ACENE|nr:hypothetical protein LWI28_001122 [Acer negundo]
MVDVDPEVATAAQPTKRTFKKFNFRGVDLDATPPFEISLTKSTCSLFNKPKSEQQKHFQVWIYCHYSSCFYTGDQI